jgi:hypothetical protein
MRRRRVPLHRSLVVRLLATSVLVAVCAILATAWLAVQTTTTAIRQEQGQSLSDDKSVYDALLGFAATHPDWSGVGGLVADEAGKLDRRITLMTQDRQVIVDSSAGASLQNARPSATVDPLQVDLGLTGGANGIDARTGCPPRSATICVSWPRNSSPACATTGWTGRSWWRRAAGRRCGPSAWTSRTTPGSANPMNCRGPRRPRARR